jgi:ubiquinone biosynthesis protein UbiJ
LRRSLQRCDRNRPRPAGHPDATIDTDPATLFAVLWNGRSLTEAHRTGDITIEGDTAAVQRLARLFAPPEPAGR